MAPGDDRELSHLPETSSLIVRTLTLDRVQEAGDVAFQSFWKEDVATRIPHQSIWPSSLETGVEDIGNMLASPSVRGIAVFEPGSDKLLAGGCVTLQESVNSIGPVFVHPEYQQKGLGKLVMRALLEICEAENAAASVRLTQGAPNQTSFALYSKLGFVPVECLSYFYNGAFDPSHALSAADSLGISTEGLKSRLMGKEDITACSELFIRAGLGYSREAEIRAFLHRPNKCWVALRGATIEAYTTGLDEFGHTIASNEGACVKVLIAAGEAESNKSGFNLPVRLYPKLLQWALASKFLLSRHMWYMVLGHYQPPAASFLWLPNVLH